MGKESIRVWHVLVLWPPERKMAISRCSCLFCKILGHASDTEKQLRLEVMYLVTVSCLGNDVFNPEVNKSEIPVSDRLWQWQEPILLLVLSGLSICSHSEFYILGIHCSTSIQVNIDILCSGSCCMIFLSVLTCIQDPRRLFYGDF